MGGQGSNTGLRTIFSFFLGLVLATFIGVGVFTFHPPPAAHDEQIRELHELEQGIHADRGAGDQTQEDRDRLREIRTERNELDEQRRELQKSWGLSTSIILIVLSTVALVVSLIRAEQLAVISNGLLLGGVFTMLYGIGWVASTGSSAARFVVMTVSLLITLGLGYVRFARRGRPSKVAPEARDTAPAGDLTEIEQRLGELEQKINRAARALEQ